MTHAVWRRRSGSDRGSAPVEFVMVLPMVLLLGMAVVQFGMLLHARSIASAAAAEGARIASVADAGISQGVREARRLVQGQLGGTSPRVSGRVVRQSGVELVEVEVRIRVPMVGLVAPVSMAVRGHAVKESA